MVKWKSEEGSVKTFSVKVAEHERLDVSVRFDDRCGNGHNTLSITADLIDPRKRGDNRYLACGQLSDDIREHVPEIAPFLKWHLCSTDGPLHYIENTVYHALRHGPTSAHVYFGDDENDIRRYCVKYCGIEEAEKIVDSDDHYSMEIDHKTAKERNLDHARSCAIWPDATDAEISFNGKDDRVLRARLEERLPALMAEFRAAVESLGFEYTEDPIR